MGDTNRYLQDKACPLCAKKLTAINKGDHSADGMYNFDQWESMLCGRYFNSQCDPPPKHNRGKTGYCYWWPNEIIAQEQINEGQKSKSDFSD